MNFALITPPKGKVLFDTHRLHYHMALAQKLMCDVEYLEMYKDIRRCSSGDFIIVDNGAAENDRQSFDRVVRVANDIGANEIIMPDELRDIKRTLDMTLDPAALELVPPRMRMIVPQGKNFNQWAECLAAMLVSGLEFRTIGVPKHAETFDGGRFRCLQFLEDTLGNMKHDVHLLGMYGNAYSELRPLVSRFPWVRGVDTGAPIAYAQQGRDLSCSTHCSLNWEDLFDLHLAGVNVDTMVRICRGNQICT